MQDAIEQVVDQFYTFLDKQGIKEKWETNVRNCNRNPDGIFIGMAASRPKHYIVEAFTWIKTPEGQAYWDAVDDAWQAELNK